MEVNFAALRLRRLTESLRTGQQRLDVIALQCYMCLYEQHSQASNRIF